MDNITIVTEKLESTEVNATMVTTTTYDTDDSVIDAQAVIYTEFQILTAIILPRQ